LQPSKGGLFDPVVDRSGQWFLGFVGCQSVIALSTEVNLHQLVQGGPFGAPFCTFDRFCSWQLSPKSISWRPSVCVMFENDSGANAMSTKELDLDEERMLVARLTCGELCAASCIDREAIGRGDDGVRTTCDIRGEGCDSDGVRSYETIDEDIRSFRE
jgi:hypothetical protein